jgi:hypothetical protein
MMHGHGKSDSVIVATKPTNKVGQPTAEPVERRAEAKGNADQQRTCRAQNRESVSHALDRIRQAIVLPSNTQGGSRMREIRTYGSVRVAPCKRVELSRLRWRSRQSLASSRVPSLAWRPATGAAKRRQGGCRPEYQ